MQLIIIAILLTIAAPAFAQQQQPAAATSQQTENTPAPAPATLENPESPIQRFLTAFAQLSLRHNATKDTMAAMERKADEVQKLPDVEVMLIEALTLQNQCRDFLNSIDVERSKQVDFKADLDSYATNNRLLRQEAAYVLNFIDALKRYGLEQDQLLSRQQAIQKRLTDMVSKAPPPEEFTNHLGIVMRIIRPPRFRPFYISAGPVTRTQWKKIYQDQPDGDLPKGEITYNMALDFVAMLTKTSGSHYQLITPEIVGLLERAKLLQELPAAIWLTGKWSPAKVEMDAAYRFGVALATVWDPSNKLATEYPEGNSNITTEVISARYPNLGCMVATDLATGNKARLVRLQEAVDAKSRK